MLLDRFAHDIRITDDMILSIMEPREPEICITEEILCAAIPNMWDSYSSLLQNTAKHSTRITEKALATAAKVSDRDRFLQVLKAADTNIRITQDILSATVSNSNTNGTQIMWLLLRVSMSADEVDTDILKEVLQGDKWGIMSVILKRRGATIRLTLKFLLQYKATELDSILEAMSADEQVEFVERRDKLFERFERDYWDDIFKRRVK
ncbi:putative reverse transcriptase [Purpureocillium lavendulum]|uniref:Reverse transcriptase n=1 Tax=Purpureocillium lavendulum TaxID=1247861 RepID=A0AB34FJS1_9HYPO|nr:putative reverse transcriptase [Purpureocillium lavendulum]